MDTETSKLKRGVEKWKLFSHGYSTQCWDWGCGLDWVRLRVQARKLVSIWAMDRVRDVTVVGSTVRFGEMVLVNLRLTGRPEA